MPARLSGLARYSVIEAANGIEADEALRRKRTGAVDLVVSDRP